MMVQQRGLDGTGTRRGITITSAATTCAEITELTL